MWTTPADCRHTLYGVTYVGKIIPTPSFDPLLTQTFNEGIYTWAQSGEPGPQRAEGQERGEKDLAQADLAVIEARGSNIT